MDITTFLAALWGPVMIGIGIGIFSSHSYYKQVYSDIGKDAFAGILFGMVSMTAGIAHVLAHNLWSTGTEIIISIIGWGLLFKGSLYSAFPKFVDRVGESWSKFNFGPFAGTILLLLGAYLSWFAYFI